MVVSIPKSRNSRPDRHTTHHHSFDRYRVFTPPAEAYGRDGAGGGRAIASAGSGARAAAARGQQPAISLMTSVTSQGAAVPDKRQSGATPCHVAAASGDPVLIQQLIRLGGTHTHMHARTCVRLHAFTMPAR